MVNLSHSYRTTGKTTALTLQTFVGKVTSLLMLSAAAAAAKSLQSCLTLWDSIDGRIDAFELWCWRRLLRVPWTERRSNQCILGKISPECSLEGLMLKLKLQYFGHLMRRTDSFTKTLMLGKI